MAKCKSCKKDIPEGSVYCEDCLDADGVKSKESYLDNLLNSVMKPKDSNNTDFIDDQDIKDFDKLNIMEDLEDAEDFKDQVDFSNLDDEINISDEELFGISLDEDEDDNISISSEVDATELEAEDVDVIKDIEDIIGMVGIENIGSTGESKDTREVEEVNMSNEIDEDILSLLNQMSSDDPFMAGITDMLEGTAYSDTEKEEENKSAEADNLLAEALAGVNYTDEDDMVAEITQNLSEEDAKKKKLEKKEKLKKLTSKEDTLVVPESPKEESKDKKANIFTKIFSGFGSKSSKSEQVLDKADRDSDSNVEAEDKSATKKSRRKTDKGKKAAKKSKGNIKERDANEEDNGDELNSDNQGSKKLSKKEARKAKKAEKRKAKAITTVVEEVEEDQGRINPVGTAAVLIVFGAIAAVIYFGTHSFAYNNGIIKADNHFAKREYSKAYEEISGMDLKEEDIEIYNKLQTVMLVNKQLNSYYNYSNIEKYPEALDSLLKGLQRYDKYIELATFYGIKSDLDYVRDQIVVELDYAFNIAEDEAIDMINIGNRTEYSTKVYKMAMENN